VTEHAFSCSVRNCAAPITVAAMADVNENGFSLASFSSRGPTRDNRMKPDIAAPGVNISAPKANSGNQYVAYSGTSMATPSDGLTPGRPSPPE